MASVACSKTFKIPAPTIHTLSTSTGFRRHLSGYGSIFPIKTHISSTRRTETASHRRILHGKSLNRQKLDFVPTKKDVENQLRIRRFMWQEVDVIRPTCSPANFSARFVNVLYTAKEGKIQDTNRLIHIIHIVLPTGLGISSGAAFFVSTTRGDAAFDVRHNPSCLHDAWVTCQSL